MTKSIILFLGIYLFFSCVSNSEDEKSIAAEPLLKVSENGRYLEFANGVPFLWLGGTTWGMSEWLTREEVDYYLDNRKDKGFNIIQICLFWGKREDDPVRFFVNPPNAYGHRAFEEIDGIPDVTKPKLVEGGSPLEPNDYWDQIDYIVQAISSRDMIVAILPVWGRRYVNGTHTSFSKKLFNVKEMYAYGAFLGDRYKSYANIIWVLGGDVPADAGGDYLGHYRSMAEGIIAGITKHHVKWNEDSPWWDDALMTYHPDGTPMKNSSTWFQQDKWLDFNMIETWQHRDSIYAAVRQDYKLDDPVKPTIMGEPAYEGEYEPHGISKGIHMRRQAYQSFFAGAAGFTYGAFRDKDGNGPLFSPFAGWKKILDMEGANSMKQLKKFFLDHDWPFWTPIGDVVDQHAGKGEYQKVAVQTKTKKCMIYFPDNSHAVIDVSDQFEGGSVNVMWFNPKSAAYSRATSIKNISGKIDIIPPDGWQDAICIISEG